MEKIRLSILGCGGMAGAHAERLRGREDVQVVGLCDVNEEITQNFWNQRFEGVEPRANFYTDAAAMYEAEKPDGVIIVTPHTMHFEQAKQALEAGCHVLLEKPMVTDSEDAHKLAKVAKDSGKIFVVGYNTPCKSTTHYVREIIRSQELGKLEMVSGWLCQDWKKITTNTWRQQPELSGGGMLYDSGAHILNSLMWTVEKPVTSVQAFVDNRGCTVDIAGVVNVMFADGVLASISIDGDCPANGAGMVFFFEEGRVEFDGWNGSWVRAWRGSDELSDLPTADDSDTSTANFIESIKGNTRLAAGVDNGILQSELMDAIYQSAESGAVVKVQR